MTTTGEPAPLEETPDLQGAYPRLSPEQIRALAALGQRREAQAGDVLYQEGDTSCDFFGILAAARCEVRDCFDAHLARFARPVPRLRGRGRGRGRVA